MKQTVKSKALLSSVMLAVALSGCASVTISPPEEPKLTSAADFEESQDFFFWGLTPEKAEVDAVSVCDGNDIAQMQAQTTVPNALLTIITLGIYSPRTAKVWCEE